MTDSRQALRNIRRTLDGFGTDVHGGEEPDLACAISQIVDYLEELQNAKENTTT